MAQLIRRRQLVDDSEYTDVHLIKRDDRKITFVTGLELLEVLQNVVVGLLERDQLDLAAEVLNEIKAIRG